jgi:serine protease Do
VATGQGISFAIPINLAKEVLAQLSEKGRVTRGFLGIQVQQVAPELARSSGLERPRGAHVAYVQPDSPGAQAGIREGDVIVEFNGRTIINMQELPRLVANTAPGSKAGLRLIRHGREHTVPVSVGDLAEAVPHVSGHITLGEELGLTVQELKTDIAKEFDLPNIQGVVVTDVEEGGPADEGRISRGDLILEVNRQQVTTLHDFVAALDGTAATKSVLFLIRRGDHTLYVALEPE